MAAIFLLLLPLIIATGIFFLWRRLRPWRQITDDGVLTPKEKAPLDPYQDIQPLHDFDWSTTAPIQIRPFKPKYHLTMGLENCPLSELVAIDKTYMERMKIRTTLMDSYPLETYQCNPPCEPAVMEIYEWMFGTYLPQRFPTMYKLVDSGHALEQSKIQGPSLHNVPANEYIPLYASSAAEALYTLGRHVDDELLFLLPLSQNVEGLPIYHLQAYVCCFPSGFSLPDKFGLPLVGIHKPVPGYEAKLEKSMDRFFAKLETGKAVRRVNWGITTNDLLYSSGGNHMYAGGSTESRAHTEAVSSSTKNEKTLDVNSADLEEIIEEQKKDVVIENCRLRCERQTLHRLPKTKALVFGFKTYQYRLEDVKAEGSGAELAVAIDGLSQGSVPDMAYYKRAVVWQDRVTEYLRS